MSLFLGLEHVGVNDKIVLSERPILSGSWFAVRGAWTIGVFGLWGPTILDGFTKCARVCSFPVCQIRSGHVMVVDTLMLVG